MDERQKIKAFFATYWEWQNEDSGLVRNYSSNAIVEKARYTCRKEVAREVAERCANDEGYQELERQKAALLQKQEDLEGQLNQVLQGESVDSTKEKIAKLDQQIKSARGEADRRAHLTAEAERLKYEAEHLSPQDFDDGIKRPTFSKGAIVALFFCIVLGVPNLFSLLINLPRFSGVGGTLFAAIGLLAPGVICGLIAFWIIKKNKARQAEHAEVLEAAFEAAKSANAEAQAANAQQLSRLGRTDYEKLEAERASLAKGLENSQAFVDELDDVNEKLKAIDEDLQAKAGSFEKEAQRRIEASEISKLQAQREAAAKRREALDQKLDDYDLLPRSVREQLGAIRMKRLSSYFEHRMASTIEEGMRLLHEDEERSRIENQHREEIARMREQYERESEERERAHQDEIEALNQQHEDDMNAHWDAYDELYQQHQDDLDAFQERLDERDQWFQDRLDAKEQQFQERLDARDQRHQEEVDWLRDRIDQLENED